MIVNETPHTTPSHSEDESREQKGDVVTLEGVLGLPIEIQVIILQYLQVNLELLSILCRANKLFNELVMPILYANIHLRSSSLRGSGLALCFSMLEKSEGLKNFKLLQRQNVYIETVRKHPEYLAEARHLAWAPTESGWAIFPGMTNIRSIDSQTARLSGSFYNGSLECILLTSPYLTELHLDGAGEVPRDVHPWGQLNALAPFLDLCSLTPGRMPNLKSLKLSRVLTDSTHEPLKLDPESWARFLRHYAYQLNISFPLLKSGEFKRLKRIELLGAAKLTPGDGIQITEVLSSEVDFLFPAPESPPLPGSPTPGDLPPELTGSDSDSDDPPPAIESYN